MERKKVISSNLKSVGYDENLQVLEIEFHGGRVYQYMNVPIQLCNNLMNAPSHGKFFHRFIRDVYPTKRIR